MFAVMHSLMLRDVAGWGEDRVPNREMSEANCFMWELKVLE